MENGNEENEEGSKNQDKLRQRRSLIKSQCLYLLKFLASHSYKQIAFFFSFYVFFSFIQLDHSLRSSFFLINAVTLLETYLGGQDLKLNIVEK